MVLVIVESNPEVQKLLLSVSMGLNLTTASVAENDLHDHG
jgi:hypothetical protein